MIPPPHHIGTDIPTYTRFAITNLPTIWTPSNFWFRCYQTPNSGAVMGDDADPSIPAILMFPIILRPQVRRHTRPSSTYAQPFPIWIMSLMAASEPTPADVEPSNLWG